MAYIDYWLNIGSKVLNNIIGYTNPTWPQLCLIIVLLFIYFFRKNISNLLDRVIHIGATGVDFQQSTINPPPDLSEEINKPKTNDSQIEQMKTIQESIQFINNYLDEKYQNDPDKAKNLLISELATAYFNFRCQSVYNLIFGSQIQLLKSLNNNRDTGLSKAQANEHYNVIINNYPTPLSKWNIDNYLHFLTQSKLITLENESYKITHFGVDFLIWLLWSGLPDNKPF